MVFLKEHLKGIYTWRDDKEPSTFDGEASRRLFDRFDGEQVLRMINLYGSLQPTFTIEDGRKIEDEITRLPLENQSEVSVLSYLKELYLSDTKEQREYIHFSTSEPENRFISGG